MSVDTFLNSYEEMGMTLGHNEFSDWTTEEKKKLLGARVSETEVLKSRSLSDLIKSDVITDYDFEPVEQTSEPKSGTKGKSNCGYGCKACVS
jgi:hypothetical protein